MAGESTDDVRIEAQGKTTLIKRIFCSAEIPFFFYVFGLMMHVPILQQYSYLRFSKAENFPYNFSAHQTSCGGNKLNETLKILQRKVQELTAHFQIAQSLCNSLPSFFVCLVYGSWSDKVGRKPLIILGMLGALLEAAFVFFTMLFDLPLTVVLVGNFFNGIGGYYTGLMLAVMAYVADTTAKKDRALRLGILEAVVFTGSMISNFLSGYCISAFGFTKSYILVVCCLLTATFCTIFLLEESVKGKKPNVFKSMFNKGTLKYPLRVWHVLTKPRPGKWKIAMMFPATLFINMLSMGISAVITLFLLNSPLCLPPVQVGYFTGTRFMLLGLGAAFGIKLLRKIIPTHVISLLGIVSYAAFYTILSMAKAEVTVYVAVASGVLAGTAGPVYRSILSQTVDRDEQGALFSAVSSMEMLAVFVASFIFNAVYPVVNDRGHPGAIFYLVDGMLLLPFAFNLIYTVKIKNETKDEELKNIIEETSTNPGDENTNVTGYGSNSSTPPTTPRI